ncbi:MAG TPA: MlaD family protein [Acetobacteraceae bacterium]|nr:MlaD family protein [Acetobacteraceae bacterium]
MTDVTAPSLARASTRRSRRLPVIWIIPLLAVAIGVWLAWDTLSKEGPTITIAFDSAEGLQPGQSQLKFKDIVFGTVKSFRLSPDRSHVLVTVATTRQAEPLLTDTTQFWVVKPRLFAGNLSGFSTLLSGSYIGMLPAAAGGNPERSFVGREEPPVLQTNVPGRTFLLRAHRLGSITLGSPVFFRDLDVGQVLGWDIGKMAENVTLHVFVRAPFDAYVHDQTRFWDASGVSVKLAPTGIDVQLESLRALLLGGVAFETPDTVDGSVVSTADHVFPMFPDRQAAQAASYTRKVPVISYFNGSVNGLGPGSPVTIHGLVIGRVTDVRLLYDRATESVLAPVRYEVEPERVIGIGTKSAFPTVAEGVKALLDRGLRAKLQSVSLITGQQGIALDFVRDAKPAEMQKVDGAFVLPTTESGGLGDLQAAAATLLQKVNEIPFDRIGEHLSDILAAADNLTAGPQTKQAAADLTATLAGMKDLVHHLNADITPALRQLPALTAGLQKTTTSFSHLAVSLDNGYGNDTKFNRDLGRALIQLNEALSSIRALADLLARHPEALIRGRPGGGLE